ncbi:hypothetical protein GOP47_0011462 [Adiantum capillus-veneris]|uniref:Ubiquitin-like protease family profile domain-containing protein n=1 Tax=Adiantum capillus-veneris TaxID=13818 RepID=A0A9D4ZFF0_ADICA|nr:hypothetical protein GOP47_0011462 [Adiantum capillus-veneris]
MARSPARKGKRTWQRGGYSRITRGKADVSPKAKNGEEVQPTEKSEKVDIAKEQEEGPFCHEESFTTPPTSPHVEGATSQPRRSPRKHTLHEMGTPSSLNIRPRKKLVGSRECGVETEDVAKGEAQEVFEDLPKQEEAAGIQEPKVYLEIELPDGRLACQCRASADCPKRSAFIFKRLRMMSHLKTFHGITVEIEKRPGGRPLHTEAERRANLMPNPEVKAWHKAALKRFGDKDRKFRQNCKRYQRIRAHQVWKDLGNQYKHMSEAAFIEEFVAGKMRDYMAVKALRLAKIQKRIDEGYNTHKRMHDIPPWLEAALEDTDNEDPFQYAPEGEDDNENYEDKREEGPGLAETLSNLKLDEDPTLLATPTKKKLPIQRGKTQEKAIEIGSPDDASLSALLFYVGNNPLTVEKIGHEISPATPTRSNRALYRFSSHVPMSLNSLHFGLRVDIDDQALRFILSNKASMRTMNLFAIWMEYTLGSDVLMQVMLVDSMWYSVVDATLGKQDSMRVLHNFFGERDFGECVLTFFPIIYREHWTCCVMYLATHAKIVGLRRRKNHILYYGPLGWTTMMDIVPVLHSAMEAMAQGVKAHDVQHALLEPATKFELKVLKGPIQPNAIDCGFYVMAAIRYIIQSCLQEKSKSWVKKTWFIHDDVLALRQSLHSWFRTMFDVCGKWPCLCIQAGVFPRLGLGVASVYGVSELYQSFMLELDRTPIPHPFLDMHLVQLNYYLWVMASSRFSDRMYGCWAIFISVCRFMASSGFSDRMFMVSSGFSDRMYVQRPCLFLYAGLGFVRV